MRPQYTISLSPQEIERFWSRVQKDGPTQDHCPELGPCWPWSGKPNSAGYGRLFLGQRSLLTHRIAFTLSNSSIPNDLLVCHRCDFRLCCRPEHLFLGDHVANARDMVSKGRGCSEDRATFHRYPHLAPRGEAHKKSKLKEAEVLQIRAFLGTKSQHEIAALFNISQATVSLIARKKSWVHLCT